MSRDRGGPPPRGPPYGYGHYNAPPPPYYHGSPHQPPPPHYHHQQHHQAPPPPPVSPRGPPPPSPVSRFGPPASSPSAPPPPSPAAPKLFALSDRPMNRDWTTIEEAERQVALLQRERTTRTARMQELDCEIHRSYVALGTADLGLTLIDDRIRDLLDSVNAMQSGQLARDYPDPHIKS